MKLFRSYSPDYKDGEQKRDFIYVKDAVEMTLFFDPSNPVGKHKCGIFNVGSGNAFTWNQLAYAIFKAMNLELKIEYVDMPDSIKNQYQYFSYADISKIRNAGFAKPITSLEDAVADYVQNYLSSSSHLTLKAG